MSWSDTPSGSLAVINVNKYMQTYIGHIPGVLMVGTCVVGICTVGTCVVGMCIMGMSWPGTPSGSSAAINVNKYMQTCIGCIPGVLIVGMCGPDTPSARSAWLDPLKPWVNVDPPALGIDGVEPPTPCVEGPATACLMVGPPSQIGCYEGLC